MSNPLVYSTQSGKIATTTKKNNDISFSADGFARIHRETKGRKGAGVSVIRGLELGKDDLKPLCKKLKQKCGCGGAIKEGTIELQTDDREKIRSILEGAGFKSKIAGG
ncbi:stress response translation initiation inhibitor YciH [Alteromonas sp. 5E99-2]|uniref:translation initiation factor n=1 Tax=Alteromonas sp. 5E99-2 TaxID=2817683 RepID=UPI001A9A02D0|nr:stress response translation initiation inhibitor YciH [Alteromonas sp. 5E99-2]MBO1256125.1 stress response translation initiation inhibitor YciH [Alteromonas sp. 5E99-2]